MANGLLGTYMRIQQQKSLLTRGIMLNVALNSLLPQAPGSLLTYGKQSHNLALRMPGGNFFFLFFKPI